MRLATLGKDCPRSNTGPDPGGIGPGGGQGQGEMKADPGESAGRRHPGERDGSPGGKPLHVDAGEGIPGHQLAYKLSREAEPVQVPRVDLPRVLVAPWLYP